MRCGTVSSLHANWRRALQEASIVGLIAGVFGTLSGVAIGHWLSNRANKQKRAITIKSYLDSLSTEIRYCGELAATYIHQPINAPLYRLPSEAYHRSVPVLLSEGIVSGSEWSDLQKFYLQVDQVNRGLDNVDAHYRSRVNSSSGGAISIQQEINRLQAKCNEMKMPAHGTPAGALYEASSRAALSVFNRWNRGETV